MEEKLIEAIDDLTVAINRLTDSIGEPQFDEWTGKNVDLNRVIQELSTKIKRNGIPAIKYEEIINKIDKDGKY